MSIVVKEWVIFGVGMGMDNHRHMTRLTAVRSNVHITRSINDPLVCQRVNGAGLHAASTEKSMFTVQGFLDRGHE